MDEFEQSDSEKPVNDSHNIFYPMLYIIKEKKLLS